MKAPTIWRGRRMSIAKAALIVYYEDVRPNHNINSLAEPGLMYDQNDIMHNIVEVAWANHASWLTASQVSSRLWNSIYWSKELIKWMFSWMKWHWNANHYLPSSKWRDYYNKNYKGQRIYKETFKVIK